MAGFIELCAKRWPDKLARLKGGFYKVQDENGEAIPFRLRPLQEKFLTEQHGLDLILKARQLGFTTLIQIDYLDDCLFIPNIAAGVIAHNREDAEAFFNNKIRFAYDTLPDEFKALVPATQDSTRQLRFGNGSSIRVGTSLRSGTFQRLHISEYGKLCAKFPDKAREVKSGALNTVHVGQKIRIESTAEGQGGHFYDLCQAAQKREQQGVKLTSLDFKLHFAGWHLDSKYVLNEAVNETAEQREYFDKLEAEGVILTGPQRAWYAKKSEQQDGDMKREFPSTPDEAFEASVEGAYFATEMRKIREQGRICRIPILNKPVDVYWDLGVGDAMALTFKQRFGAEERIVDYHEMSGEGFEYFARILNEKKYIYGDHYFPHDGDSRSLGLIAKTKKEWAEEAGIAPITIVPRITTEGAGIEASRAFLPSIWIDEERCSRLIQCLDNYRKDWDDKLGTWKSKARHDEFSHGYKSFETAAVAGKSYASHQKLDYSQIMRRVV